MSSGEPVVDLWTLSDLGTPWCIRVVATLRIAEHVDAGVSDIDALAAATSSNADALHSVLSYLVTRGIFIEEPLGHFALNDAARGLLDAGAFLRLDGIGGRMSNAWSTLPTYVRTGKPGYAQVFGAPFWEDLDANPDIGADFDALMSLCGPWDTRWVVPAHLQAGTTSTPSWTSAAGPERCLPNCCARIAICAAFLSICPVRLTRAAELFASAGVADRVTVSAQSFFDPLPRGADVYLLRKVLNDWPDEEKVAILRRCAEAARPSGVCRGPGRSRSRRDTAAADDRDAVARRPKQYRQRVPRAGACCRPRRRRGRRPALVVCRRMPSASHRLTDGLRQAR